MGEGQENTSIKIVLGSSEAYILRIWGVAHSSMGVRKQTDIEGELDFMIHCSEQDLPVPKVHLSKAAKRYEHLETGEAYVVMDYVPGDLPVHITPDMVKQVAETMARMHCLAEVFQYRMPRSWSGTVIDMTNEQLQVLPQLGIDAKAQEFIGTVRQAYEKALQTADLASLPRGPIHGDIMWENMKFQDGILQGVFDFDDCRDSYFLEDVAKTLIFDFHDPDHCFFGKRGENVQEFLSAYRAIRPFSEHEEQLVPLFLTAAYLYRLLRYLSKSVNGKMVYQNRLPMMRERFEDNRSFFLPV
jgi:homoserine kinase type II